MKKLLGLALCVCAVLALSLGSTGCGDKKKDDKKTDAKKTEGGDSKAEVKVKAVAEQELKAKTKDQKVAIELEADAPADLTVTVKADKIDGKGTIKKGDKKTDIMVETSEGAKDGEVTGEIAETGKSKKASFTFKAKIK